VKPPIHLTQNANNILNFFFNFSNNDYTRLSHLLRLPKVVISGVVVMGIGVFCFVSKYHHIFNRNQVPEEMFPITSSLLGQKVRVLFVACSAAGQGRKNFYELNLRLNKSG
jgi:hypothetical protein